MVSMTLIVAMKYQEGVIASTDGRATYADLPLMREEPPRAEILEKFVVTGAGLFGPLDRTIDEIKDNFRLNPSSTFDNFVEMCEDVLWKFYQKYAERIVEEGQEEDWVLVTACPDKICRIMPKGWAEEESKYLTEGSGYQYAEYILKQRYRSEMNEEEVKELTVYTVDQTSRIDPSVGGSIRVILTTRDEAKFLSNEEITDILEGMTQLAPQTEKEIQRIVHEIVEKRRWINTTFNKTFGFELFEQNEFAISEIQKGCINETDFTSRISALALLTDGICTSNLSEQITAHPSPGSINALEAFLKEKCPDFNMNLIINLRDIMTLRSKKMPIHEDNPKIIQVILKWEHTIPPNWASLWKQALMKYKESLLELEKLLSS